ncbi:ABC transporter substrate-binding protein [Alkalihalophilus lindianensis]|uniref:ABC transporter substrate-binding protein n=1 Tax=Alkalihalophilus lindianensis TaxID=1630542 RepID=A0ABU3X9H9_9BACI|nr:ABC transporter substrate-binding protein [Alkalihalophilus lindianensis]MDV2683973.1 ABC transporter substrate-binding protein [Alkalihalophilus lindianensis]
MSKRAVIVIILCFLVGVSLIYVGPYSNERDEKNDKELVELTFLRNLANHASNQAYEELVSEFEEAHPHIKINMLSMHWANEYELRLRTELVAGNHPDIMSIDSPNLALYANAGTLLSLDRYMKEEGNIEDIFEHTLKGLTYQDEIYVAPIAESSIALFYNKHLFNEAGIPFPSREQAMTWDEVLDISKKIHNPEQGIYGIDPAQGFSEGEGPAYFKLPFLWQFGADVLSPDGTTAEGYLNSEEALEALKFYQDLYLKHRVATVELPPVPFESNQLAMTVMGSWHLVDLESYGLVLGEDFGIAPLPKADYQVTPNGGWTLGISAKSEHPDEAWEFIKFATSYNAVKKHSEITGDIPARHSVVEDLPELKEYPKNIFIEQGQSYSKNRPVTPAYPVISKAIKDLFEDIVLNEKDVKEAADEAVEKINNALNSTQ